jgi:hypothetical protein
MMRRWVTIAVVLALGLPFGPIFTEAQPAGKPVKIGVFSPQARELSLPGWGHISPGTP